MRAGVLSLWAGLLLMAGEVVFAASGFSGSVAPIVEMIGAAITCAGFVWLRVALMLGSRSGLAVNQQPSHAG